MKKIFLFVAAFCCTVMVNAATAGALTGRFTINAKGDQVYFSQGNLQYQASSNKWQFAAHQYDTIGAANANISASNPGWIDLFGWGTGNNPTLASAEYSDYATFVDWGVNPIANGGNQANLWRTLTKDEWVYLFYGRANAAKLFGLGSVNGVNGTILLPDNWSGDKFTDTENGLADQGNYFYNEKDNNFSFHTYTAEQWSVMEAAGAVFLPAAGFRFGSDVIDAGAFGNYQAATPNDKYDAFGINFSSGSLNPQLYFSCTSGRSVRLVCRCSSAPAVKSYRKR